MSMNERAIQRGEWAGIPGHALQYYIDQAFVGVAPTQPTVVHVGIAVDVLQPDHDPERDMLLRGLGISPPQPQGYIEESLR